MDETNNPTTDLLNILSKAMDAKVYGSIEVYLEEGQITQISQRVIKKIKRSRTSHQITVKKNGAARKSSNGVSLKF
jgi:hypothetical protein